MIDTMQRGSATLNTAGKDTSQFKILIVLLLIFSVVLVIYKVYVPFYKKAKYFKMEMKRSDGEEYLYWRGQRRKLFKKYIPFAALFLRKKR